MGIVESKSPTKVFTGFSLKCILFIFRARL